MIERLDTPLNMPVEVHAYLGVGILSQAHLALRRTSLISAGFLPMEI